ncbi:unnamed protein product [Ectocarpus sp. 13 AM-2016]
MTQPGLRRYAFRPPPQPGTPMKSTRSAQPVAQLLQPAADTRSTKRSRFRAWGQRSQAHHGVKRVRMLLLFHRPYTSCSTFRAGGPHRFSSTVTRSPPTR